MLMNNDNMYGSPPSSGIVTGYGGTGGDEYLNNRPKPVFFWSNGEVMKWLKRQCQEYYELYGHVFLENEITGRSLIRINEQALLRMGIENPEHRDQLARFIVKQKLKSDIIEIKDMERKGLHQQQQQVQSSNPPSITITNSKGNHHSYHRG